MKLLYARNIGVVCRVTTLPGKVCTTLFLGRPHGPWKYRSESMKGREALATRRSDALCLLQFAKGMKTLGCNHFHDGTFWPLTHAIHNRVIEMFRNRVKRTNRNSARHHYRLVPSSRFRLGCIIVQANGGHYRQCNSGRDH